jgi:hypothetical protein
VHIVPAGIEPVDTVSSTVALAQPLFLVATANDAALHPEVVDIDAEPRMKSGSTTAIISAALTAAVRANVTFSSVGAAVTALLILSRLCATVASVSA